MRYYFDTSALCRYYHVEHGSQIIEKIIDDPASINVLSWLTVLEAQSAFAIKVRNGEIADSDFRILKKKLKSDIAQRTYLVVRVLRRHFNRAELLLAQYGLARRLRSLDALHLGVALDLHLQGRIDAIVTADSLLAMVAQSEGLTVVNPLNP